MKYRIREQNELKPSGVEWLGDIPKDWEISRISNLFSTRSEKVSDKEFEALSVTKKGIVKQLENVAKTDNGDNRKKVLKNDFVINSRADRKGSCGVSPFDGSVSLICHVLTPNKNIYPLYANYLFRNYYFSEEFYKWGTGIVADLWSTNIERMKKISFPFIDLIEQQKIADFLDEKSKIFDEAISKKEQLILKLELAKQSLINEVVTGKLKIVEQNSKLQTIKREKNELKSSGVEWLGDIPKEWQVKKLGYIFSFKNGVNTDSSNYGKGIKFINVKETINTNFIMENDIEGSVTVSDSIIKENSVRKGDVLFNRTSETIEELALSTVYYDDKIALFGGFVIRGRQITKDLDLDFKRYCFQSSEMRKQIISYGSGSIRKNIAQINLKNVYLFGPTLTEQQKISKYLDEKLIHFDNTIEKTKQSITKLKEAKEALISQAVTGKIEVL